MTARDLFQKDKALREKLAAMVHADWFEQALLYARSAMLEASPTTDQLKGAQAFEAALMSLCADPDRQSISVGTGLIHDLDNPRKEIEEAKEAK